MKKIKFTLFKTERNFNEFLLITKINEEIYTDWPFDCMEVIPVGNCVVMKSLGGEISSSGPALMAEWYKSLLLTASCLSPLPGYESHSVYVRKLPVTWG